MDTAGTASAGDGDSRWVIGESPVSSNGVLTAVAGEPSIKHFGCVRWEFELFGSPVTRYLRWGIMLEVHGSTCKAVNMHPE